LPVALITAPDGVCHPTPAALIISRQRRIRDGEIGPEQSATIYLTPGGRSGLVAATDGDSAGVSQTDAGRPWAAAAAALLVIHGVAAGMRRDASRNGDYGTLGILVEGGWSGGWSDGRRSGGMSPLIG